MSMRRHSTVSGLLSEYGWLSDDPCFKGLLIRSHITSQKQSKDTSSPDLTIFTSAMTVLLLFSRKNRFHHATTRELKKSLTRI